MGHSGRVRASFFAFVCLVALVGVPLGATQAAEQRSGGVGVSQLGDGDIEPDGILMRVDLQADGDARWTVEYRIRLNDDNTTAAFESLQRDIDSDEQAYTSTFGERMRATARAAENATGREMQIRNVSVRATRQQLPQEYGVVTYEFEWTNFAATTDDGLQAGDALAGLFLDRQTTLVVAWPQSYEPTTVAPTPDDRRDDAVVWVGPTDFGAGEPVVSLSTATGGSGGSGTTDDGTAAGDGGMAVLAALGVVAVAIIGGIAVFRRRRSTGTPTEDAEDAVSAANATAGVGSTSDDRSEEGDGSDAPDAEPAVDEDDTGESDADDQSRPWDDELLSNAERVTLLLEHNDGRMKQQAIASELEWSDAKTSQVIGQMRDSEDVETFRLGRENVVSLPESDTP